MENKKFDFNDITLVPAKLSSINTRLEIDINLGSTLPLMVSPMDTVIDEDNRYAFSALNYVVCIPRNTKGMFSKEIKAISLDEFIDYVVKGVDESDIKNHYTILVDIANGHMQKLYDLVIKFKADSKFKDQKLMIGNIANPETFELYALAGVDYIRLGVGSGQACLTSANTAVHYPMASLIKECYDIKKVKSYQTKLVADGGFKNYDDIIKALALGADYVMMGSILNKSLESCSITKLFGINVDCIKHELWDIKFLRKYLYKEYRGMSTKAVQKKWNSGRLKTAEGISKRNPVEYTLQGWTDNFKDYLRSAMSYCGSKNLEEFKKANYVFITESARKRFEK